MRDGRIVHAGAGSQDSLSLPAASLSNWREDAAEQICEERDNLVHEKVLEEGEKRCQDSIKTEHADLLCSVSYMPNAQARLRAVFGAGEATRCRLPAFADGAVSAFGLVRPAGNVPAWPEKDKAMAARAVGPAVTQSRARPGLRPVLH